MTTCIEPTQYQLLHDSSARPEACQAYETAYRQGAAAAASMGDRLYEAADQAQRAAENAYWGLPTGPLDPAMAITWTCKPTVYDMLAQGAVETVRQYEILDQRGMIQGQEHRIEIPEGPSGVLADDETLARCRGRRDALELACDSLEAALAAGLTDDQIDASLERWARAVEAGDLDSRPHPEDFFSLPRNRVEIREPQPDPDEPPARPDGDPGPLPNRLLTVPGFCDQVVQFNLQTCKRIQPALALPGALCLQAVLIGRKVRDEYGSRPNIQFITVAKSGKGKDAARQINSDILTQSQLSKYDGPEEVASDAGLYAMLANQPALLWQIDEFGRFLKCTANASKSPHLYNVIGALMKLYTSAAKLYQPKGYGDRKQNLQVDQPCLVLFASTTPDALYGALSTDAVHDGFLGRCLIVEGDDRPLRQMIAEQPVPTAILETARFWDKYQPGPGNLDDQHPTPTVITTTPDANKIFESLATDAEQLESAGGRGSAVWTRAEQKARQLALIYACSANREQPVIDTAAAQWACDFTRHLTDRMVHLCSLWVSTNEQESRQQRVFRIVQDAGGRIGQRELTRATQWLKQRERLEILLGMEQGGMIRQSKVSSQKTVWEVV